MMARRRSRLRLALRHTALELRKWSKTRLIRLILRLEAARIPRIGHRISRRVRRAGKRISSHRKRLSPGVHNVRFKNGKTRKVRVLSNGQWRFLKGKARGSTGTRRRKGTARRAARRRRR